MKNKLRIVFLDFDDIRNPLLGAGQAKATYEVGRRLAAKGHKVTVLCSRYPGAKDRTENGISYIHIGVGSRNVRVNNAFYILSLPLAVRRVKADIIVECFTAPVSTLFSPLFTKVPVVALTTSFEAERFTALYKLPFDRIQNFGLRFYKYAIPYTAHLQKKITRHNPSVSTRIIPEGVGKEFFSIKRKKPKYILYLGRLDIGQKGLDLLIDAYASVQDRIPYPLIIAGAGPDKAKLEKRIAANGLKKNVTLAGPAFGVKKKRLLEEAAFVAFPSRHEGFSLFSLEALASGLPLVSFAIPSLSFAGKNVALKAKPFDTGVYASLLLKAATAPSLRGMSENARALAGKYSWERVASDYEAYFTDIHLGRAV